jgi:lipoprotein
MIMRLLLKLIVLPVMLAFTLFFWVSCFLLSFSGAILYLFSGICFLLAGFCYLAGICSGTETVRTLAVGFVAFALPNIAGWLVTGLAAINARLCDFLRS